MVTSIGTPSPPLLLGSRQLWVGPALLPSPPYHSSSTVTGFGWGLRCCHHLLTTPHRQSLASGWACTAAITYSPLLLGSRRLRVGPALLPHLTRMQVSLFIHGRLVNLHGHIYRHPAPPLLLGGCRPSLVMPPPLHNHKPLRHAHPHLHHGHAPACTFTTPGQSPAPSCAATYSTRLCAQTYVSTTPPWRSSAFAYDATTTVTLRRAPHHSSAVAGFGLCCYIRYTIVRSGVRLSHTSAVVRSGVRSHRSSSAVAGFGTRHHTFCSFFCFSFDVWKACLLLYTLPRVLARWETVGSSHTRGTVCRPVGGGRLGEMGTPWGWYGVVECI